MWKWTQCDPSNKWQGQGRTKSKPEEGGQGGLGAVGVGERVGAQWEATVWCLSPVGQAGDSLPRPSAGRWQSVNGSLASLHLTPGVASGHWAEARGAPASGLREVGQPLVSLGWPGGLQLAHPLPKGLLVCQGRAGEPGPASEARPQDSPGLVTRKGPQSQLYLPLR